MAVKQFILLLFIGFVWCKNENSLILDESFYDNGNKKYQRYYKDGKAQGTWIHYYDNGNIWTEGNYKNGIQENLWVSYY